VARDATARLYDVDANCVVLDKKVGTIDFKAKKGHTVDLDKLHESVWATRLGDGTGMALHRLIVTVEGELVQDGNAMALKVPGTGRVFILKENPKSPPNGGAKSAFQQVRDALDRGERMVRVTGTVEGWQGNWTRFTKSLPAQPRTLLVEDFNSAK
jgi:hypothetical protein